MKELFLMLLLAGSAVAQSPTNQAVMKGSPARATVRGSRPSPTPATRVSATNDIRIVEGKAYHVLSASNWVTLPGPHERARYARSANYGPVFSLEKRMAVRYRQHAGEGTRVWVRTLPGNRHQELSRTEAGGRRAAAGRAGVADSDHVGRHRGL